MNSPHISNSQRHKERTHRRFFKYLYTFCNLFHVSDTLIQELKGLKNHHEETGELSPKDWFKFLNIFKTVIDIRAESSIASINKSDGIESTDSINASFYRFGLNVIKGYLSHLQEKLSELQALPMKGDTLELILNTEDEIHELNIILTEAHTNTDWKGFRTYIDDLQVRIAGMIQTVGAFEKRKATQEDNIKEASYTARKVELTRERAWGALLDTGKTSNATVERIKTSLSPDFSYDEVTNTIIKEVKSGHPEAPGIKALNIENIETRKAMAKVLQKEGGFASPFSLEVRDDLHKIYGKKAANDELIHNTLADTFSEIGKWSPVHLSVVGFDEFQIMTHEKNVSDASLHTLKICARKYGSDVQEILTITCDPRNVRAGAQARVKLTTLQPQKGDKRPEQRESEIYLNINSIGEMKKISSNPLSSSPIQPKSFWDKTKNSVKSTWNNWFSKKAA